MKFFETKTSSSTTVKVFYLSVFWAIFIIVIYGFAFLKLVGQNERTSILVLDTENLTKEKVTLLTLKGQAVETTTARKKLADYFIPRDGVVTFLNNIQDLGRSNNVELKVDSVLVEDESGSPEQFEYLKLAITGSGTWTDVYRFESLVELIPYKVIVDNVRFEKKQPEGDSGTTSKGKSVDAGWRVKLELRVLKLK